MTTFRAKLTSPILQTLLPVAVLAALAGGIAHQTGFLAEAPATAQLFQPQTVTIAPRTFAYREDGEFLRANYVTDAPMRTVTETWPLTIMKHQVSLSEYTACVSEGVCSAPVGVAYDLGNVPVTGVNYDDARAYARWLSDKTGELWSLPTDQQLAFAAGKSFPDDAFGLEDDGSNPAIRWLADYRREAAERSKRDPVPRVLGSFGENEYGLSDFGGNVWEWTDTCHRRVMLDKDNTILRSEDACGVYVTVGNHRSPMTSFFRDPKGGGCAVGTPPDNLGFRLVKATAWYAPLVKALRDRGIDL
ncbi:formylglycine-generating enzyme required for sulfatase activity [Rhizobium azooxidifex]|uniref:Formylglycine-generating enzyme required for sulfatase activity n=1 Tax=Mycoplana azooxidifex TaxID=1636188 RepID=A0A7W6GHZ6_9HYPH|nr:formylglycine-generating enzyme family protein [Mycoplana azooxidifex]MBB3975647.1 formylglycine-generating enzyme required for sulfatase activity [Mycoplana azooxidifex]